MQVRPQHAAGHAIDEVEEVMVVVPLDAEVDEAEDVRAERRPEHAQRGPVRAAGHTQLEHHDRDEDGDDAVTERFEPCLVHQDWLLGPHGELVPIRIAEVKSPSAGELEYLSLIHISEPTRQAEISY